MAHGSNQKRFGMSRFIVPHESFHWFLRSIGITALLTGGVLGVSSWLYHQRLFEATGVGQLAQPELVWEFNRLSLVSTALIALSSALYIAAIAAFLFHRVAGPIYRVKLHMQGIIDGAPTAELRLRSTDQLSDLCATYNQLLYTLDLIESKPLQETSVAENGAASDSQSGHG